MNAGRFGARLARAIKLDPEVFEEVEHDHGAGGQALLVVVLASACGGVGNMAAAALLHPRGAGDGSVSGAATLAFLVTAFLVAWVSWSFATMAVGTLLFGGRADMGEMRRALGFAAAPGLFMLVPGLGAIVAVPWSIVAMIIAVRQACDFTTRRALATVAVAAAIMLVVVTPAAILLAARF